jgi:hypothetical protein
MPKTYRCQHCNYNITENKTKGIKSAKYKMGLHYENTHKELIPPDMTGFRYFYFLLTKKNKGSCVICHNDTIFNNVAMKYARFCNNPICKEKYKEERNKRMMKKYGKLYLLNDPEQQKKMQSGRKIAGIYNWSDNKSNFGFLSSYEKDFLEYLDIKLHWPSSDILAPSPHTYSYDYGGKSHYYMPDFFIPSLNLEIEIKSSVRMEKQNPESRAKEIEKDKLMRSLSNLFNYCIIYDKKYEEFEELLKVEEA